jgi:hypothetical protein
VGFSCIVYVGQKPTRAPVVLLFILVLCMSVKSPLELLLYSLFTLVLCKYNRSPSGLLTDIHNTRVNKNTTGALVGF